MADEILRSYEMQFGPFIGMANQDKAIWIRFLQQGGSRFSPFAYNIRVGQGPDLGPDASPLLLKIGYTLGSKRIDVVAEQSDRIILFEVKPRAGSTALGQLILYRELYVTTFNISLPIQCILVTDVIQPDMQATLDAFKIGLYEVGY